MFEGVSIRKISGNKLPKFLFSVFVLTCGLFFSSCISARNYHNSFIRAYKGPSLNKRKVAFMLNDRNREILKITDDSNNVVYSKEKLSSPSKSCQWKGRLGIGVDGSRAPRFIELLPGKYTFDIHNIDVTRLCEGEPYNRRSHKCVDVNALCGAGMYSKVLNKCFGLVDTFSLDIEELEDRGRTVVSRFSSKKEFTVRPGYIYTEPSKTSKSKVNKRFNWRGRMGFHADRKQENCYFGLN